MTTLEKKSLKNIFEKNNIITPNQKDEDWLYYNIEKLLKNELQDNTTNNAQSNIIPEGNYLFIKNGKLEDKKLSNNIILKDKTHQEINENSFVNLAKKTSDTINLSIKNSTEKLCIIYESICNINSSNINIELENSKLNLERVFITNEHSISNNYMNIKASQTSTVIINETNNENKGHTLDFVDSSLEENCHLIGLNQSYLSDNSRFENRVNMNGESATARLNGLCINAEDKECFYNTHVFHNKGNNESHQLFKSINKNNALFEYNGKVSVKKDAQQINSYQLNQNICLDDFATIHSRPQLFIDADDVKCSHGSTTGDLNKEELFYLKSRGLDEVTSKKMVLRAFVDEVFQHEELRDKSQKINHYLDNIL